MFVQVDEEGNNRMVVESHLSGKKKLACLRTVLSHCNNMIIGVTRGFQYKMRLVYAHFPINVAIEENGKRVEIRNFLGEKRVRIIRMLEGVNCVRSDAQKDELLFQGNDIDEVGKSCALVNMACLVKHKDIRKFLDGIYISARGNLVQAE